VIDPLYSPGVFFRSSRSIQYISLGNGVNLFDLSEFTTGQTPFDQPFSRYLEYTLSGILLCVLGCPCKKGAL